MKLNDTVFLIKTLRYNHTGKCLIGGDIDSRPDESVASWQSNFLNWDVDEEHRQAELMCPVFIVNNMQMGSLLTLQPSSRTVTSLFCSIQGEQYANMHRAHSTSLTKNGWNFEFFDAHRTASYSKRASLSSEDVNELDEHSFKRLEGFLKIKIGKCQHRNSIVFYLSIFFYLTCAWHFET
jgi:hypothetical protein